ncbi:MAG: ABC transporter permease [bacterium]|nr:ABC transporter permease [bacterium]
MLNFQRIYALFKKEFVEIVRDKRSLVIVFIMPIVMILIYGYAVTFDIKNIDIGIIDRDNSSLSRGYINKIVSSGYFIPYKDAYNNMDENIKALRRERIKVIIVIPYDFTANLKKGKDVQIQCIVDGSIANTAIIGVGYLQVLTSNFANNIKMDFVKSKGINSKKFPYISPEIRVWYNQELRSTNFIVPGLISTIMMLVAALLTSLTIVRERENGTYEEIMSTPVTSAELIIGKLTPYIIIGLIDVLLVTLFGVLWFHVPFRGNIITLLFFSFLFILCALGMGMLMSSIAKKQEEAIMMTFFSALLPSILLSGFVFPVESMPKAIQVFSYFVPARYFLNVLRAIFLKQDVTILMLYKEALFLIAVSIFFLVVASKVIKKRKL